MAEFTTKQREKLADEDEAMPDGSYPIRNRSDLKNAIQAFGRSKNPEKTKRWIKKRARELDAEDLLPDSWIEHSDDSSCLVHYGVLGMKWGIRKQKKGINEQSGEYDTHKRQRDARRQALTEASKELSKTLSKEATKGLTKEQKKARREEVKKKREELKKKREEIKGENENERAVLDRRKQILAALQKRLTETQNQKSLDSRELQRRKKLVSKILARSRLKNRVS